MSLHVGALLLHVHVHVSLSVSVFRGGGAVLRRGSTFRLLSLLWQYPVLVFTKSVNSNFRVLIGFRNSEYPWLFTHGFAWSQGGNHTYKYEESDELWLVSVYW